MRVSLAGVGKFHGARTVLEDVTLAVSVESRLGVVGPNGVGKSTLLRLLSGLEEPDTGTVARTPATLTIGYLPQEPDVRPQETLLASLARRTGIAGAERDLERQATALQDDPHGGEAYDAALDRFLALGGGDFEARARTVSSELGLPLDLDRELESASGGERARASLAAILLSRFDILLLDEPTNDLDFDGLERLERFVGAYRGGLVVVSHDRAFLDRTVTRIAEIDGRSGRVREWAGGWSEYEAARERERRSAYERWQRSEERRRDVAALLAQRRNEARTRGAALGEKSGGADRRGTHALMTKVRQAERALERVEEPEKPWEPWQLQLTLQPDARGGDVLLALEGAVARRGDFRLGPISLSLAAGDRIAVIGRNGAGKTTLLGMLLGSVPLEAGVRQAGRATRLGTLEQERDAYGGDEPLLDVFRARTAAGAEGARTLLAKFGLGAEDVLRRCSTLSPGERTRAQLAELQERRVNLLVLDEPTNHLDLEAIEQLESALAEYPGALVVVSHDRRFLERVGSLRAVPIEGISASD